MMGIFKKIIFLLLALNGMSLFAQSFYNGEFTIRKIETRYDSVRLVNYMAYSNLYADSVDGQESWHADDFGSIYFNSTPLIYNSNIKTYHDTIQRNAIEGVHWIYSNSGGGFTSFTTTCSDTFPIIQTGDFFPDTLRKTDTDSLYIYFGEVTNVDKVELTMFDGVLRILFPFNRTLSPGSVRVTVPGSDLLSLEGESVTLTLNLTKSEYKTIGGKRFRFQRQYSIVKSIPVVTN